MRVLSAALLVLSGAISSGDPHATAAPTARIIVVRHAERASATDRDSPLSEAGRVRAAALDSILAQYKVVAIYVTPYKRTNETAEFVARRQNVKPVALDPSNVGAYAKAVADSALKKEGVVLIVSHSNTVPAIVAALSGTPKMADLCDAAYSHIFTVIPGRPATVTDKHYGAPDPENADSCKP